MDSGCSVLVGQRVQKSGLLKDLCILVDMRQHHKKNMKDRYITDVSRRFTKFARDKIVSESRQRILYQDDLSLSQFHVGSTREVHQRVSKSSVDCFRLNLLVVEPINM